MNNGWPYLTPGLPDALFVRGEAPMTKEEVRAVVLSKLRLTDNSTLWDIGAGTGSVSVEAALLAKGGSVWAVERDPKAAALIKQNKANFACDNLTVVEGDAPEVLHALPVPDRVFLGGSRGRLPEILAAVAQRLAPGGILVADFVVLENLTETLQVLKDLGFRGVEAVQVAVTKTVPVGGKHMLQAQNPVYIVSGSKG